MKKMDIIIIAVLLAVSFLPEIIFGIQGKKNFNNTYAEITISGKHYKTVPLSSNKGEDSFLIKNKYGENKIVVRDSSIAIIEADCPDKVCIQPGFISKPGESLVCLPHKLMIEIKGAAEDEEQLDKVSH
ncbi:NusG domain II-containing protein [Clostridium polynesiense]|uniref:NusG domain II-containing protein n=1 Tax=Clostridium polynesiense TaxID=1325933 RepID=UPI00058F3BE8|nr:NusG domain II-containing protein [Clostridium polynesiense]